MQIPRGDAVGGDHEVFDQSAGPVLLLLAQGHDCLALEERLRLERLEVERAALEPQSPELARGGVLNAELVFETGDAADRVGRGRLRVEPGRDGVVGKLGAVVHDRRKNIRVAHRAVRADRHLDDDRQPVLPFVQGSPIGREFLGKHREDRRRRVDRSRVVLGVPVDRRALLHDRIHVGDRYEDLDGAAGQGLRDGQLIQVPRVVVVDRAPQKIAEVAHPRGARPRRSRDPAEIGQSRRGEIRLQPPLDHRAPGDLLEIGALVRVFRHGATLQPRSTVHRRAVPSSRFQIRGAVRF